MHARVSATILVSILVLSLWSAAASGASITPVPDELQDFTCAAETTYLALYIDEATTEIAVLDKRNGRVWRSNPVDRGSDPYARGNARVGLETQLEIGDHTPSDELRFMNNQTDSVAHGQYEITFLEDGVRVDYVLGARWQDKDYLPTMISKGRMEEAILKNVESEADRRFLLSKYDLISLRRTDDPSSGRVTVARVDLDRVFGDHAFTTDRSLDPSDLAKLIGHLADTIVESRDDITDRRYLGPEHFSQLRDSEVYLIKRTVLSWDRDDMIEIVKKSGYSPEDRQKDDIENNLWPTLQSHEIFEIAIEYRLSADRLVPRVPINEIVYPVRKPTTFRSKGGRIVVDGQGQPVLDENGPTTTMPLHSITLLPSFGAANEHKVGYILVPDGSGALINLNNGKKYAPPYASRVYGVDNSSAVSDPLYRQVHFPVFGLKQDDSALFAVIEEGESLATVRADISGRSSMYNRVWSEFTVIPTAKSIMRMTEFERGINVYQSRLPDTDIAVSYSFLYGTDSTYSGMARHYQSYLQNKYGLERLTQTELPFYLELLGAIDVRRPVMGISRDVSEPLTTASQAAEITSLLIEGGVRNLDIILTGFADGGIDHYFPSRLRWEKTIGTNLQFEEFVDYATSVGARLYPSLALLIVHKTSLFDGFSTRSDAARSLTRQTATIVKHNPAGYLRSETARDTLLSPGRLMPLVEGLLPQLKAMGVSGLCLPYLGQQVNSDFREKPEMLIDRQQATELQAQSLAAVAGSGLDVLVRGGNEYVIPHANGILGIPDASSNYRIIDRSIPFLQMVLHGYVNYAGEPLNLSDNYRESLLRCIELGAVPYYQWMWSEPEIIKGTDHDYLYSANYASWLESAVKLYHQANRALGSLAGQRIVEHQMVADGVYVTVYEQGVRVVVNYREEPIEVVGVTIEGRSFEVLEGGDTHEGV